MRLRDLTFDNDPRSVVAALATVAVLLLIVAAIRSLVRRRFARAAQTDTELDDWALDLARRTSLPLLFIPLLAAASSGLTLPPRLGPGLQTLGRLALIAQLAFWIAGLIELAWRRYGRTRIEMDRAAVTTVHAFRIASLVALWTIAVLAAVDNLGFDVTALVAGLGIGGVAIALATQSILGDLFASLSIVVDKPFVVGDFIRVGDDLGAVERIGLKTTRVRSLSGEQLIFGNADLLKSRIRNYHRMDERRVLFRIGVVYQTSAATLRQIPKLVRGIIEAQPSTRIDRAHFAEFGPSEYVFEFVYYVLSPDYNVYMDVQESINNAIVSAFEERGIEFAYPTRTIFLANPPSDARVNAPTAG
ncbi:MAG TPA: mechanosensitive ion channel family protein [Thermoanaerobaculia bacterium]